MEFVKNNIVGFAGLVILCAFVFMVLCYIIGIAVLAWIISLIPKLMFAIAAVGVGILIIVVLYAAYKHFVK